MVKAISSKTKKEPVKKPKTKKTQEDLFVEDKSVKDLPEKRTLRHKQSDRYYEGIGRRKTSVARVRLYTRGDRTMTINQRSLAAYFSTDKLREEAKSALTKMNVSDKFRVVVKVSGGGVNAQAEAVRLGSARALLKFNPEFRKRLKKAGFLTRDPRMVERKKPGLKKARRAPQWQKR